MINLYYLRVMLKRYLKQTGEMAMDLKKNWKLNKIGSNVQGAN